MSEPGLVLSLYFDEDVSIRIVRSLRNRGFDAQHAMEVGMKGKSDDENALPGSAGVSPARGRGGFETHPYRRQSSRLTFMAEEMMQQLRYI